MASSNVWSSELAGGADTIVAPATPPGSGALAVVRVSGPAVAAVARTVCPGLNLGTPRLAQLVVIRDGGGRKVERGVIIPYRGPASYTGEDMLEVMVHGSQAVVRGVVEAFVGAGCRRAERGEFTRRAVANGKMDLVQAEGVAALAEAETALEASLWQGQVDGVLSRRIEGIRAGLVDLMGRLEAVLDFSAQDVEVDVGELERRREAVVRELKGLLSTVRSGRRIRDGVRVVILGPPNAGKSTLFNRLLRSERAIVAPEPGTTRDYLEAEVEMGGLRVVLVDTAGVGEAAAGVEREGMERSQDIARSADCVVLVQSCEETESSKTPVPEGKRVVHVRTKLDLVDGGKVEVPVGWVAVSALSGAGLERLEATLERVLLEDLGPMEGRVVVNERQGDALSRAEECVRRAILEEPELAVEDLRMAVESLKEVLGEVSSEEVLDAVFSTFCLGK